MPEQGYFAPDDARHDIHVLRALASFTKSKYMGGRVCFSCVTEWVGDLLVYVYGVFSFVVLGSGTCCIYNIESACVDYDKQNICNLLKPNKQNTVETES